MSLEFAFRRLSVDHLPLLLELQEEAFCSIADPSLLRRNSPSMLRSCLLEPNVTLGAWIDDILAGFSVLFFPADDSECLASSLRTVTPLGTSANNKLCIVRPQFRGHRLQLQLGLGLEELARQQGVSLLCATASPLNSASCLNLLAQGYLLDCTLEKYGYSRNLFYKILG